MTFICLDQKLFMVYLKNIENNYLIVMRLGMLLSFWLMSVPMKNVGILHLWSKKERLIQITKCLLKFLLNFSVILTIMINVKI